MKALLLGLGLMTMSFSSYAVLECDMYKVRVEWNRHNIVNSYLTSKGQFTNIFSSPMGGHTHPNSKELMQDCFTVGTAAMGPQGQRVACACERHTGLNEDLLAQKVAEKVAQTMQQRNDADFNAHRMETFKLHENLVQSLSSFLDSFEKFVLEIKK